jgi:hypothetical protein
MVRRSALRFAWDYLLAVFLLIPFMALVTVITLVQLPWRILRRPRLPLDNVGWAYLDWMEGVLS